MSGYNNIVMDPNVINPSAFSAYNQLGRQQAGSQIAQGNVMPSPQVGAAGIGAMQQAQGQSPWANSGLGFNLDTARLALGGLQTIANIWAANRAYKLQRDMFNHQRDVTETNLMNSIQSYNTALSDRSYARAHMEGRDRSSAEAYTDENRMRRNY